MNDQQSPRSGPGLGPALQDVTQKVQLLVKEEVELAKAEVTLKAKSLGRGAAIGAAAGIFALGALLLILHGIAWLLWYLIFPDNTFFWGFFLEALILLVFAAIAGLIAARALKKGSPPAPQMAIDEAKLIRQTVQHPKGVDR